MPWVWCWAGVKEAVKSVAPACVCNIVTWSGEVQSPQMLVFLFICCFDSPYIAKTVSSTKVYLLIFFNFICSFYWIITIFTPKVLALMISGLGQQSSVVLTGLINGMMAQHLPGADGHPYLLNPTVRLKTASILFIMLQYGMTYHVAFQYILSVKKMVCFDFC